LASCRQYHESCAAVDLNLLSPAGDEVATVSKAWQSAELAANAFTSLRSFGCGCAAPSQTDLQSDAGETSTMLVRLFVP